LTDATRQAGLIGLLKRAVSPRARVLAFSVTLAAVGLAVFYVIRPSLHANVAPLSVPWPIFAVVYFLAEIKDIEVHFRRENHSFSLSELPAVIGLFFVDGQTYILGLVVGAAAALFFARQPAAKILFNLSQFILGSVLGLAVFHALSVTGGIPGPISWVAAFAATLTTTVVGSIAIATVITVSGGAPQFGRLPQMLQVGVLFAVTNTSLALLAVNILWDDPLAIWLVGVPVVTMFVAYRAYLSERQKHESLELLYESSQIFRRSPELDSAILALLEHARLMFHSDRAEIIIVSTTEGQPPLRTAAGPGDQREVMVPAPERAAILDRLRTDPRPYAYVPGTDLPSSGDRLFRFAMVSPLQGEAGLLGAILIADRMGDSDEYDQDQLRMLETVGNQAAAALENGQLEQSLTELSRVKEELHHLAYHDPLTGLANRVLFLQAVDARVTGVEDPQAAGLAASGDASDRAAGRGRVPVVLFLDLDDFKMVNDTVGHGFGDRLLQGVAERIVSSIRPDDLAARLGGDEFAILLADAPDLRDAKLIASRIAASLLLPFRLGGREFIIGASVGVAAGHAGEGADEILRNADVAMYASKARGKSQLSVWDPNMHAAIIDRHELSTDLSRAISQGELEVHYQPLVALDGRGVIGFEALVRWNHPTRGPLSPELFVPLAEESGAVVSLGSFVLRTACAQSVAWSTESGLELLAMSVNLSPLQVHRQDFTDEVLTTLLDAGLDPRHLVLEMTETAMFSDIDATISKLQALRQRGVRIAVDDFGTGYSSLRWLRQFPVDILKVAREFIVERVEMVDQTEEWAFAHAIVALGKTLGLTIVAEGIETVEQRDRLQQLGCDYGQGFLFSRAVAADAIPALVKDINDRFGRPHLVKAS
jgi:diguanylate cyclase (GGDEF)-like protein